MAGWVRALGTELGLSVTLELPHLSLRLLRLDQGERATVRTGRGQETAAVFASGRAAATADGRCWGNCGSTLAASPWLQFTRFGRGRSDGGGGGAGPKRRISPEFRPLQHTSPWPLHQAIWLPPEATLEVQALEPAEVLLIATDLGDAAGRAHGRPPALHGPNHPAAQELGSGAWRRLVVPLLTPGQESISLGLGETYNPPGGWSTYPPHRHDRQPRLPEWEETQHEEIYVCRFAPPGGFGMARVYDAPGADAALVFRHAEVLAIVQGYHTVVAAPGYHLHYLWALGGPRPAKAVPRRDPAHTWVEPPA